MVKQTSGPFGNLFALFAQHFLRSVNYIINIVSHVLFQENLQKLMELQRDLIGLDSLVHPDRVSSS